MTMSRGKDDPSPVSVWPSPIVAQAPAKVNLCLLVGPRRKDGYHPVFSVFAPLDLRDEIVFRLRATPGTLPGPAVLLGRFGDG